MTNLAEKMTKAYHLEQLEEAYSSLVWNLNDYQILHPGNTCPPVHNALNQLGLVLRQFIREERG